MTGKIGIITIIIFSSMMLPWPGQGYARKDISYPVPKENEESVLVEPGGIRADEETLGNDTSRAFPGVMVTGKMTTPVGGSTGQTSESLPGYFVTVKIPDPGTTPLPGDGDGKPNARPVKTPLALVADPRLDNPLHDTTVNEGFQADLSPKEAFLYGRIAEAGEIHDFERGISLINHFLNEFPDTPVKEKLFFQRGDFFYRLWRQGDPVAPEMAIKYLQEAVDQYGDSECAAPGLIKISQVNSCLGNNNEAIGLLSILIHNQKTGYLPLVYLTRGKIYLKINQPEKAVEDLKILLREYPDSLYAGEAQFWIANYLHIKGVYDQAKARLDEVEKTDPEIYYHYPEFLFLRAQNYVYLKKYDQAREYFYKGLNIGSQPESVDLLLARIGDTYHRQSRGKEAERIYRMVVDYYPKSEGACIAKLCLADYTSDMGLTEEISQGNPGEPITDPAVLEKADKHYEEERLTDVMDTLRDMILKPVQTRTRQEAKQLFLRAAEKEITRLFQIRQYGSLIDLYRRERLILSDRLNPNTVHLIAQAYYLSGEYQNALVILLGMKACDLDPGILGEYLGTLAGAYLRVGLDDEALDHLEKHQKDSRLKDEDSQKLTLILAGIYRDRGDLSKAFDKYQGVIKSKQVLSDSKIAEICLYLGQISNRQGKSDQAVEYLNRCLALIEKEGRQGKNLSLAFMELGNSYYDRRQYTRSINYYRQGFDLGFSEDDPDYWHIRYRLAMAYLESGKGEKAEPHFREILEEAGPIMQQRAQVKLGMLELEKQLNRLSIRPKMGE